MNDQPKPTFADDCTMPHGRARVPRPAARPDLTWPREEPWPLQLEAEPWRP